MKQIFDNVSVRCSKLVTNTYSTSFSIGISLLNSSITEPIYSIYGFVRLADEIVDSFHGHDRAKLLQEFIDSTDQAISNKISLNPILNSFQKTVHKYNIEQELIDCFFKSMKMDLKPMDFNTERYKDYITGSAEVVGLMCLRVFCVGDEKQYQELKADAMSLGAAFQKINFLRDMQSDYNNLGRMYFPDVDYDHFDQNAKLAIEQDIQKDFDAGLRGIKRLPKKARLGVYIAYVYYYSLFKKIMNIPPTILQTQRIRISNRRKYALFASGYIKHQLNYLS
ncbi:MAG: phytoene/squalene synthase family protein [Chitinophagales bacterium]